MNSITVFTLQLLKENMRVTRLPDHCDFLEMLLFSVMRKQFPFTSDKLDTRWWHRVKEWDLVDSMFNQTCNNFDVKDEWELERLGEVKQA